MLDEEKAALQGLSIFEMVPSWASLPVSLDQNADCFHANIDFDS